MYFGYFDNSNQVSGDNFIIAAMLLMGKGKKSHKNPIIAFCACLTFLTAWTLVVLKKKFDPPSSEDIGIF